MCLYTKPPQITIFTFKSILGPTHTHTTTLNLHHKILNMIKRWCEGFTSNMQTATQSKEHISFAMFGTQMIEDRFYLELFMFVLILILGAPWLVERDHEYPMLEHSFSPSLIYTRNNNPTAYQLFYKKSRNQTACKKLPHSVQDYIFQVPNFKWKRFKSSNTEICSSFCQTVLFVKV